MTAHSLKGIDLGKVGANKDVNFTFKEFMDTFGGKNKKIPEMTNLGELEAFFGSNELIPGLNKTVDQLKVELQPVGLPKGAKVLGDGTILPKDAPTGISGAVLGFLDRVLHDTTDFDKRGVEGEKVKNLGKIDLDDLSQYKLLPNQQNILNKALEQTIGIDPDPTSTMKEGLEAYQDFKKISDTASRKGKILDNAIEFINMQAQTPFLMKTLKDASTFKQQQLLDAEAIKQGMPNALQARLLAADSGFAQQAAAIAGQSDAATRMAGLGVFPRSAVFYNRT
tara:strand:- start:481 stop:1323 length:843 start_codon:yes stop_codon:yes gene_type:complete